MFHTMNKILNTNSSSLGKLDLCLSTRHVRQDLPKAWFSLVLRIVRICDFYDLPTSGIPTTSVNTPSQTVGGFYDVIGRIGSISTLKALSQTVPDVGDFYDECEHEISLSGTSGTFDCLYLLPKLDFQ